MTYERILGMIMTDDQSVKIVRRITGRARFFQRALALMAAK